MPEQTRVVSPGPISGTVRTPDGQTLHAPADWVLVPPGDPALTRRLKAAGPTWTVQEKRGRKIFSRGVWALATTVESLRGQLIAERDTPQYAKRREASVKRRDRDQAEYVQTFGDAVLQFLAFDSRYAALAQQACRGCD